MTEFHKQNKNLIAEAYVQNLRFSDDPKVLRAETALGLVADLDAGGKSVLKSVRDIVSRATRELNAGETRASNTVDQAISDGLGRWRDAIYDRTNIDIQVEGAHIRFRYDTRYLMLQGVDHAIVDARPGEVVVDTGLFDQKYFNVIHEDGGIAFDFSDAGHFQFLQKDDSTWPSAGGFFRAISEDGELHQELVERQAQSTPMTAGFLVALGARHANHVPTSLRVKQILAGVLPTHQQLAVAWMYSLSGAQLSEVERFGEAWALRLHETLDDLSSMAMENPELQDMLATTAFEREELDAMHALFHLIGVATPQWTAILENLDERAADYAAMVPRHKGLGADLVMRRSASADSSTWWAQLVPEEP